MEKGRVCVTGGTGFLGSWLIKRLIQDGYSVNATIRPSSQGKNIDYLTTLPGASERLQIFNADLDNPESFAAAIEGCIGVFHLVHPVDFGGNETEEVRIKRSVDGITGILQACLNSKTVRRVVYTSSVATVMITENKDQVDETTWSDVDFMRTKFSNRILASYALIKMSTEKAALEFREKNNLDVVTILPPWIHGPFICPNLPGSVRVVMSPIFGHKENYSYLWSMGYVHTDDVARAHIFLFEYPNAKGRYICSAVDMKLKNLSELLLARYPEYPIPNADSLKDVTGFNYPALSTKKLLDTGFKYNYGIEEMYDEAIQCCKQKGFL